MYHDSKLKLRDKVLGKVEKNSFYSLPSTGGHHGLMPSKLCVQPRGFARSFIVKGKVDDNGQGAVQGLHSFGLVIIWCHVLMRKL